MRPAILAQGAQSLGVTASRSLHVFQRFVRLRMVQHRLYTPVVCKQDVTCEILWPNSALHFQPLLQPLLLRAVGLSRLLVHAASIRPFVRVCPLLSARPIGIFATTIAMIATHLPNTDRLLFHA